MKHEKEFHLANGDTVKVEAGLWVDYLRTSEFGYNVSVGIRYKGKRKFQPLSNFENSEFYNSLIKETQTELWQKLKP